MSQGKIWKSLNMVGNLAGMLGMGALGDNVCPRAALETWSKSLLEYV